MLLQEREASTLGCRARRRVTHNSAGQEGGGWGVRGQGPRPRAPVVRTSEPGLRSTLCAPAAAFLCGWRQNSKKPQLPLVKEKLKLDSSASSWALGLRAPVATQASPVCDDGSAPGPTGLAGAGGTREGRHSVALFPFLEEEEKKQLTGESRAARRGRERSPSAPSEPPRWRGSGTQQLRSRQDQLLPVRTKPRLPRYCKRVPISAPGGAARQVASD